MIVNNKHISSPPSLSLDLEPLPCPAIPRFFISKPDSHLASSPPKSLSPSRTVSRLEQHFKAFRQYGGIPVDEFADITRSLCELPSFCGVLLAMRINELFDPGMSFTHAQAFGFVGSAKGPLRRPVVRCKAFLQYWMSELEPFDPAERLFRLLKRPEAESVYPLDLIALLQEFAALHPSLDVFSQQKNENENEQGHRQVQDAQALEDRYILTVLTRIFYEANTSRSGKLSLREFRRGRVLETLLSVDSAEDVNREQRFFSCEHFFVLHSVFSELDEDGDGQLFREDLLRYRQGALSPAIIDRLFAVGERAFSDGSLGMGEDGMSYADFVFFMLSETDMTTPQAVKYWFRCCDLDGDGHLCVRDMQRLFQESPHGSVCGVTFEHVWDEMRALLEHDCADIDSSSGVCVDDLLHPFARERASGVLLSSLFDRDRFHAWEHRSLSEEHERRSQRARDGESEWVRFVANRIAECADHPLLKPYKKRKSSSLKECSPSKGAVDSSKKKHSVRSGSPKCRELRNRSAFSSVGDYQLMRET